MLVFTVNRRDSSLDGSTSFSYSSSKTLLLSSYHHPLLPTPVKQLGSRLTVFAGHSGEKRNEKKKELTYLIFTVLMSILFPWVLVSQRVHLDALLTAERRCDSDRSASLCRVWRHWCNCVEMVVCSTSCYLFKCYGNITLLAISA